MPRSSERLAGEAKRYPERCLWASNWPHPNVRPQPAEGALLDWSLRCFDGDESGRHRMLVDNPAELYGFGASTAADQTDKTRCHSEPKSS